MSKIPTTGRTWRRLNPPNWFPLISSEGHVLVPTKPGQSHQCAYGYRVRWPNGTVTSHTTLRAARALVDAWIISPFLIVPTVDPAIIDDRLKKP